MEKRKEHRHFIFQPGTHVEIHEKVIRGQTIEPGTKVNILKAWTSRGAQWAMIEDVGGNRQTVHRRALKPI